MNILTPSGYKDIADCAVGDEVSAFDAVTGAPIVNVIENIEWVDAAEWVRWHTNADLPEFLFYRINDAWILNSEQSIWRNGIEVCHAKHLQIGDEIYDDADQPVLITSVEEVYALGWHRFDISGDHSYIVDGLTLHNASRFWVGGTGTWDRTTTTHWASSSNGASGASAPGSADTATLDGSSGGGTVTVGWDTANVTVQSITCGAFTGTLDFSANNNNVTLSANSNALGATGSATRTINLGNGSWTFTAANGTLVNFGTTTGLTFNANSSTIVYSGSTASLRSFVGGGLTFNALSLGANAGGGTFGITGANTFASVSMAAPNSIQFPNSVTTTITNAFNWAGTPSAPIFVTSNALNTTATVSVSSGSPTMSGAGVRVMAFTGGATFTATSSFDLGLNTGITITPPSSGRAVQINNDSLVAA